MSDDLTTEKHEHSIGPESVPRPWSASDRRVPRTVVRPLRRFADTEAAGGVAMLAMAIVALVWANSPFGERIAHGVLVLGFTSTASTILAARLVAAFGWRSMVSLGYDGIRFIAPVRAGKRIRGHWKLLEMVEKRPGQWQQTNEITIEIEGADKPALICEWMTLFFC